MAVMMFERLINLKENESSEESMMVQVYSDLGECYKFVGREEESKLMESRSEKVLNILKEKVDEQERKWQESSEEEESEEGEEGKSQYSDSEEENKDDNKRQWKV